MAEKTAERRSQAADVWDRYGQKWLTEGDEADLSALLLTAPEIQGPIFEALARNIVCLSRSANRTTLSSSDGQ